MLKKILSLVLLLTLIIGMSTFGIIAEATSLKGFPISELIIEDNIVTPDSSIWNPNGGGIALRQEACISFPPLGPLLPHGTQLTVLDTHGSGSNMWLLVRVMGTTRAGWVQANHVL